MTLPIYDLVSSCCSSHANYDEERISAGTIGTFCLVDALVWLTTLVSAILSLTVVAIMTPAASYSLIGIASGITALYITMAVKNLCQFYRKDDGFAKTL